MQIGQGRCTILKILNLSPGSLYCEGLLLPIDKGGIEGKRSGGGRVDVGPSDWPIDCMDCSAPCITLAFEIGTSSAAGACMQSSSQI